MTESEVLEVRIGDEHITPEQIMDVNIGTYGPGDYVLPTGQKLEAQLLSNNSIRIFDGVMVYCGVRDVIAVNNYHDVTIENGQQGMNRNDIIVRHFEKNEETQFGGAEFQVIKGTATSGDASDPEITDTDLRAGALTHDMKLYRARLEGLNVVAVEPLFETLPSIPELNGKKIQLEEVYAATGLDKNLTAGQTSSNLFSQAVNHTGYAYIDVYTIFPAGSNRKMITLCKNGSEIKRYDDTTGTSGIGSKISVSAFVPVSTGDTITAQLFCATVEWPRLMCGLWVFLIYRLLIYSKNINWNIGSVVGTINHV